MFTPRLDVLPVAQRILWPELAATPKDFTLYGGTAIALRLGHRASVDFDFFSALPFDPEELASRVSYLGGATRRQSAANTLTVTVDRGEPVQVSFFGGMRRLGQVEPFETVSGPKLSVASLLDLGGMKVAVVARRAELKDYLDIHALIVNARVPLSSMLAAAKVIYGEEFNPIISLKAISYFEESALADLSASMRRDLLEAVRSIDIERLPKLTAVRNREE